MSGDAERTQLQETGTVNMGFSPSVADLAQIVDDLGLDPERVVVFYTTDDNGVHLADEGEASS